MHDPRPPPQETSFDLEQQDALIRSNLSLNTIVTNPDKGTSLPNFDFISRFSRFLRLVPDAYPLRHTHCNDTMCLRSGDFLRYDVPWGHACRFDVQRCVQDAAILVSGQWDRQSLTRGFQGGCG